MRATKMKVNYIPDHASFAEFLPKGLGLTSQEKVPAMHKNVFF